MTRLYIEHRKRIGVVVTCLVLSWVLLSGRLFYIQIVRNEEMENNVKTKSTITKSVSAERGKIFDRSGVELSQNTTYYTFGVSLNSKYIYDRELIVDLFSETFNKEKSYYENKLNSRLNYVVLEKNIIETDCYPILFEDYYLNNKWKKKKITGLTVESELRRYYPYRDLAAQVIGYVNTNNKGVVGIEKQFDTVLKGDTGKKTYNRNGKNTFITSSDKTQPILNNGADIQLTLDIVMQSILQDELEKTVTKRKAKSANGIILNPFSGEILAIASVPSFDLNEYWAYPVQNHHNLAISFPYEPGSTFKIVTISAALESGGLTLDTSYNCENGSYKLFNHIINDHEPNGTLTISEILKHSSNIGMAKIAEDIGAQLIFQYAKIFGFGSQTHIQLPNESEGTLRNFREWENLSGPEIAIGQEISTTTLQTAVAYCAIANGGFLLKPYIINQINRSGDVIQLSETKNIRRVISQETSNEILLMLENTVNSGTGNKAEIPGYRVGGKTGTAQKFVEGQYSQKEFISSFAGIFPIDNPDYVCVVSVDSPQYGFHWGNETAAPIVRRVFERIINLEKNLQHSTNQLYAGNSKFDNRFSSNLRETK